jgi:signal peptidase I
MSEARREKRQRKQLRETNNKLVLFWRKLKKNAFVAFFVDIFTIVGTALVLSLIIKTFLLRSFYIPSGSMESTLQINDRIVVNELVPNLIPVSRGDIVVFKDPGGWLTDSTKPSNSNAFTTTIDELLSVFGITAPDSDQHLVKRVIGIPGDHVVCCDAKGLLQINGVSIKETYLDPGTIPSTKHFDVTVPKDSYWVMGDNRSNSWDSRFHGDLPSKGFVAKSLIVGKAFVITWPQKHWTWLGNYPDVFKNVPNK